MYQLSILLSFLAISHLPAQDFSSVEIRSERITESIAVLFGSGGNIGVLSGPDGFLLVDDQFAPLADKIKVALENLGEGEITYIVNSHFHFDHADGNKAYGRDGSTIVAHENALARLTVENIIKVPGFDTVVQEAYPQEALPKITFKHSMKLHLNDQTVSIFHVENAHTDNDAIVYFNEANVFHTGDVFVRYGIPFIDTPHGGSVHGMIRAANSLIMMCNDKTVIIPGHGAVSKKSDLIDFRNMLQTIWNRVEIGFNNGRSLEEILDTDPTRGYSGGMSFLIVKLIFDELSSNSF